MPDSQHAPICLVTAVCSPPALVHCTCLTPKLYCENPTDFRPYFGEPLHAQTAHTSLKFHNVSPDIHHGAQDASRQASLAQTASGVMPSPRQSTDTGIPPANLTPSAFAGLPAANPTPTQQQFSHVHAPVPGQTSPHAQV